MVKYFSFRGRVGVTPLFGKHFWGMGVGMTAPSWGQLTPTPLSDLTMCSLQAINIVEKFG